MSELKPCPFCGAGTFEIRPNGRMWLGMKYSEPASVSVLHWCEAMPGQPSRVIERVGRDEASAIEAWNRRAQPAQAVPITSESGNQAAQGASGITSPVLTDEEIDAAYEQARANYQRSRFAVRGQQLTAQDSTDWWFARAIEHAVRAKLGLLPEASPATKGQCNDERACAACWSGQGACEIPQHQWQQISTAPKDCGFLGYQSVGDGLWLIAPMYWNGSEFVLLQFHRGDTEHSMSPSHWMPLPPPPGIVGKEGGNVLE